MRRAEYLGNVTFSDPTAEEAIARADNWSRKIHYLTRIGWELEYLQRKRERGQITDAGYRKIGRPLAGTYKEILKELREQVS